LGGGRDEPAPTWRCHLWITGRPSLIRMSVTQHRARLAARGMLPGWPEPGGLLGHKPGAGRRV